MGVPTLAAPCNQMADSLIVKPDSGPDLKVLFDCEGGEFNVLWSGEVSVPDTIYIGRGTTVNIHGDEPAMGGSNHTSSSDQQQQLQELSSEMSLPRDTLSAAVVSSNPLGGHIFFVDGGQLFLNALAVRDGSVSDGSGGGVYAVKSNVTVTGCLFENNFAMDSGGGIFANLSTLVVVNSTFRGNAAGSVPVAGQKGVKAAGGGIAVSIISAALKSVLLVLVLSLIYRPTGDVNM